jgi:hypothetical protein
MAQVLHDVVTTRTGGLLGFLLGEPSNGSCALRISDPESDPPNLPGEQL